MAQEIAKGQKKIIVFGAGVIGTVTLPAILQQYRINQYLECYIDNDKNKWDTSIVLEFGIKRIYSPNELRKYREDEIVILLAVSRVSSVLEQLNAMDNIKASSCYIIPIMCIENFKENGTKSVIQEYQHTVIPKIIHYMWLGKKEMPEHLMYCIHSWKQLCPEYTLQLWDESNYDIRKNKYMSQAYDAGMYGFVPDYARLDILYEYGGIYMDTDVELLRSLDTMLHQKAFCGVEKWQTINFGGCSGAVKGNKGIKALRDAREPLEFVNCNGSKNMYTCGYYDTLTLMKYGYKVTGNIQTVLDLNIYPSDFFHPYDYMSGKIEKTENTYSIHHFNGGWLDDSMMAENKKIQKQYDYLVHSLQTNRN